MKFSLASVVAASCLTFSSAFFVQPPASVGRTSVVLEASRAAQKKASRGKWLEARGMADGATATEVGSGLMTNDGGLEYVKLVHPDSGASAEVYLFGGVVTSFKDGEGTEFIAVRPDAKMDGSKPISGGLSHCWPQVRIAHFNWSSLFEKASSSDLLHSRSVWTRRNPATWLRTKRDVDTQVFYRHHLGA
jgi:glucose-6-phosphate 1-epimerase